MYNSSVTCRERFRRKSEIHRDIANSIRGKTAICSFMKIPTYLEKRIWVLIPNHL